MGTAVIGGMTAATIFAIFIIPMLFYVVEKLSGSKPGGTNEAGAKSGTP
jgi:Cu/Ag efflux pump CusA